MLDSLYDIRKYVSYNVLNVLCSFMCDNECDI